MEKNVKRKLYEGVAVPTGLYGSGREEDIECNGNEMFEECLE